MRKVLIALVIVVLLVAGAGFVALRNLDAYVTENRDLVAGRVGEALGREVAFDAVGISWAGGLGVRVEGLRVGDDPAFSEDDFLTADAVDVQVKLLPALFGRVEVARVILRAPQLRVTQTKDGLSTDSLGRRGDASPPADATGEGRGAPPLAIGLLDMRDASVRFTDRRVRPASTLEIEQLDVRASELALDEPLSFEVSAALFGAPSRNFEAEGTVGPLRGGTPRADLDLTLDGVALDGALDVALVRSLVPKAFSGSGPVDLDAAIEGTLDELTFDVALDAKAAAVKFGETIDKAPGVPLDVTAAGTKQGDEVDVTRLRARLDGTDVSGKARVALGDTTQVDFDLASPAVAPAAFGAGEADDRVRDVALSGKVALAEAGPKGSVKARSPSGRLRGADYSDLVADLVLGGGRITLQQATAQAFGGTLEAKGAYTAGPKGAPRFGVETQLRDMRIEQITRMVSGRAARLLNGTIDANLNLDGAGSGWEQIQRALRGNGNLHLRDGVLKGINPAGDTLRALLVIPALGKLAIGRVLQNHPQLLGEGDTAIEDLTGDFTIRDGWVNVSKLVLQTTEYALSGSGRYSFAGQLDFKTSLTFGQMLSSELLGAEPDLRYVREASGRLAIPVALKGTPPKVAVIPDVTKLAGFAAREALTDVLTDALGVKKQEPSGEEQGGAAGGLLGNVIEGALGRPDAPPAEQEPPPQPAPAPEQVGEELLRRGLGELLGGDR